MAKKEKKGRVAGRGAGRGKALQQLAFFLGVKDYNNMAYKQAISYFQLATQYPVNTDIAYVNTFWLADCYYKLSDFGYVPKMIHK